MRINGRQDGKALYISALCTTIMTVYCTLYPRHRDYRQRCFHKGKDWTVCGNFDSTCSMNFLSGQDEESYLFYRCVRRDILKNRPNPKSRHMETSLRKVRFVRNFANFACGSRLWPSRSNMRFAKCKNAPIALKIAPEDKPVCTQKTMMYARTLQPFRVVCTDNAQQDKLAFDHEVSHAILYKQSLSGRQHSPDVLTQAQSSPAAK